MIESFEIGVDLKYRLKSTKEIEMAKITTSSKMTFGEHRGAKVKNLPDRYLKWMNTHLKDTDFHDWAIVAGLELKIREKENRQVKDLEEQADEFLRQYGYDPKKL